jgi:hypothetical protein
MDSAITVRWSLEGVNCELRMKDGAGDLFLIENGTVIAHARVPSAEAAYRWAAERVDALTSSRAETDRKAIG